MFAVRTLSTGTIIIGRLTPIFDFGFINFEDNNSNRKVYEILKV